MKVLKSEKCICPCCMEEHAVKTVLVREHATFKNVRVEFDAEYMFCDRADELYEDEKQIQENDIRFKDAYRKYNNLLTSSEISSIRSKYDITQTDLCVLLGWGGKTITRYEHHQVQDRAHDSILRKISRDPEWFISLLHGAKKSLSEEAYQKYAKAAATLYENERDLYLRKAIEAGYAKYENDSTANGNAELSLDKVIDVIRYFAASPKVTSLYKVKLMKLLWYADALSYKKRGTAITGLVYEALPMGAVPLGHDTIIDLKGVPCEEVDMGETNAYYFSLQENTTFPYLTDEEISILDGVIKKLGKKTKNEIIALMHAEQAYKETAPREVIAYEYSKNLTI